MADEKTIFVTVGTTAFDKLIQTVLLDTFCEKLREHGFTKMKMQIGRVQSEPDCTDRGDLKLECYRYKDSILEDINSADLVISHGGAGTCLEVLRSKIPLIIAVNEELQDNHQMELASKLYREGNVFYSPCSDLVKTLDKLDVSKLVPFEPARSERFATFMDKAMGIS